MVARQPRDDRGSTMTECEETAKLDELDRILNDPDVPMQPARVWTLLDEIVRPDPTPAA